jgi:hypothetical protein
MTRRFGLWISAAAIAAGAVVTAHLWAQAPEPLMRQKLRHAQKVLEAAAMQDFPTLEQSAAELINISKRAEWGVFKTPEYVVQSDEFRRNAATLAKAARDKNTDGTALAYVQMTMNCFNCHKHVRDARMAMR